MVAVPKLMTDPGVLYAAPLVTAIPTNTVVGGVFTDAWTTPWVPIGATTEGSTFADSTSIEPIRAAEFFNPIKYVTTETASSIAFAMMDFTLQRWKLARNGGVAALVPQSGSGATSLYRFAPVVPGSEVRIMLGWESLDKTMRLIPHQCIQGAEVSAAFQKAPAVASIPVTFNFEVPTDGTDVYEFFSTRG